MLMSQIASLNDRIAHPPISAAQQRLDEQSLKGSDWLQKRDFRNMKDAGQFFSFEAPAEQEKRRKVVTDAAQGGTFGLADSGGETQATQLQSKYLSDKFSRDDAQNFQDNIAGSAQGVKEGLNQSSNAAAGRASDSLQGSLGIMNTLGSLYNNAKKGGGFWSNFAKGAIGGAAAFGF